MAISPVTGSARVITVANQKGGVGKTSSVIQIASGLARRGDRVLAIDGDPQGNLTLFFGDRGTARKNAGSKNFGDLLRALGSGGGIPLSRYVRARVRRNLDLITAADRDMRMTIHDDEIRGVSGKFSSFVAAVKDRYDWILIDSSPSNSALERLLIAASDAVIIPLEFQIFSVAGLEAILDEVRSCTDESGKDILIHSLILTKAENRLNRVNEYRKVFSEFSIPIYEICKSEYLSRSLEKSRTIWECGPASYAARDYGRLIERGFPEAR
jgi:chromosome partitioning protein